MKIHKFVRRPFYVDAVRVNEHNIEDAAEWCGGAIVRDDNGKFVHIKVDTFRPSNERQTRARLGHWILKTPDGFKVYTTKAFDFTFEKVRTLTKEQADKAGVKAPIEPSPSEEPATDTTELREVFNPEEAFLKEIFGK